MKGVGHLLGTNKQTKTNRGHTCELTKSISRLLKTTTKGYGRLD